MRTVNEDSIEFIDLHKAVTKITNPERKLLECKLTGVHHGKIALEAI